MLHMTKSPDNRQGIEPSVIPLDQRARTRRFFLRSAAAATATVAADVVLWKMGYFGSNKASADAPTLPGGQAKASSAQAESENPTTLKIDEDALRRFNEVDNFNKILDGFVAENFDPTKKFSSFFTDSRTGTEHQKTGVVVLRDEQADKGIKKKSLILFNVPATQKEGNVAEAVKNAHIGVRLDVAFDRDYATVTAIGFGNKLKKEKGAKEPTVPIKRYGTHVMVRDNQGFSVDAFEEPIAEKLDEVRAAAADAMDPVYGGALLNERIGLLLMKATQSRLWID